MTKILFLGTIAAIVVVLITSIFAFSTPVQPVQATPSTLSESLSDTVNVLDALSTTVTFSKSLSNSVDVSDEVAIIVVRPLSP